MHTRILRSNIPKTWIKNTDTKWSLPLFSLQCLNDIPDLLLSTGLLLCPTQFNSWELRVLSYIYPFLIPGLRSRLQMLQAEGALHAKEYMNTFYFILLDLYPFTFAFSFHNNLSSDNLPIHSNICPSEINVFLPSLFICVNALRNPNLLISIFNFTVLKQPFHAT